MPPYLLLPLVAIAAFLLGWAVARLLRPRALFPSHGQKPSHGAAAGVESLFAASNAGMLLCGPDRRVQRVNARMAELTRVQPEDMAGRPLLDLLKPALQAPARQALEDIEHGRRDAALLETALRPERGDDVPVSLWIARTGDPQGKPGFAGLAVESGLLGSARRLLRESRNALISLLEATPLPIFLVDASGEFLWANQAFAELLDCCCNCRENAASRSECRQWARSIFRPDDPFLSGADEPEDACESREIRLADGQGAVREMLLRLAWVDQGDGSRAVVGALLDLTEHRDAKREMERALDHLQAILDSSLVGVALVRDRIMVNANRRAEEMFGYDPGELQGCPARILHFSTEQHQAFQDAAERDILEHGAFSGERLLRRKDGSAIWCRMHARPMRRQGLEGGVLWTMDDFTERKVMEDELLAAKEAAEAANHAKTRFLANMSHELRTPLNAVTGLTDMLLSSDLPEEQREMAATIQDATSQLLTVLSDILDYARLDTEEVELEETPFDLNALLRRIEREIRPRAQLKGLDLAIEAPEGLLGFVGDKQRLRQILLGLLGNAIKFTDQGSVALRVDIQEEAEPDAALVNFAVEDTGVGIPEAELDRIFEVFHQGDESSTRRYGGAGIGLAICRRLVHLMGGTIIPLSQAGRGSTFFVTVPLAQASPEQIRQLETQNLAEEASLEQDAQRPLSILLAEDNLVNRQVLVKLLSRRGHSTSVAVNGREAVVMLEGAPFDLVLMDIQMPEMDGLAATRAIRGHEDPRVAATPIVALTAHAMRGDRERFLEAGMDEYVPKPVNPTELEAALATALGQAPPRPAGPPAEAPDDSGLPVLDVDLALERLDHDHAFLEEMFQLYLEDAPVRIQELHAAHQEGRLRDAGDLAHSLKGISHSVGAARLAELAYSLEQAGRGGDLEGFENRLKELSQVYESTAEAIRVKREQGDGP